MALRPCEQARHIYLHEPIYQSEMFDAGMARIEAILSSEVQVARLKDGARKRQNLVESSWASSPEFLI
ncbi:hypothetical protein [Rhodococcus qingshengii]|uniref:hypothetical protein n=1 Tax=Rhodococcus qingshengii TaxID=334542 RepID=UPI00237D2E9F|nr:hypothetical protein [Rhodococcus qingshengii]WCT05822.1 hypothetical protein PI247_30590 [Rhodococcus qingshengii]